MESLLASLYPFRRLNQSFIDLLLFYSVLSDVFRAEISNQNSSKVEEKGYTA